MSVPEQKCHPDRSVAQWRGLLFPFGFTPSVAFAVVPASLRDYFDEDAVG